MPFAESAGCYIHKADSLRAIVDRSYYVDALRGLEAGFAARKAAKQAARKAEAAAAAPPAAPSK